MEPEEDQTLSEAFDELKKDVKDLVDGGDTYWRKIQILIEIVTDIKNVLGELSEAVSNLESRVKGR